ncbi:MAG: Xaa-Pro peptidase family protein [Actinobacteria bacterium]|nr:Xaa-Pro peptidase family protein [Actinomycetota bacterium]
MTQIPVTEFQTRIEKLRDIMRIERAEIFLIYGDEYRRENLRYVSNYWPIFERGMLAVGLEGEPILLAAAEGQNLAKEMSPWKELRIIHEMEMSYVPEQVKYNSPRKYNTLTEIFSELLNGRKPSKIIVSGIDAMSVITYEAIKSSAPGAKIENGDDVLYEMRLIKSDAEIEVLKKVNEICDIGFKAMLDADIVGLTEIQAIALGEKAARDAGAEHISFSIFTSGERTNTVIGRPTEKIIQKGEMIMTDLAVQYQGYVTSDAWPFVAGGKPNKEQMKLIYHLVKAEDIGIKNIRDGVVAGEVIKKIKDYFEDNGLEKYDLYPSIHGTGLAEAELPYPNEESTYKLRAGMATNFDVSLFGIPGIGSNRIEEGFIITKEGLIVLSKLLSRIREEFLSKY